VYLSLQMPDLCLLILYNPNPNKVLGFCKSDCFFWRFGTWIFSGAWIDEFLQLLLLRFFEEEGTCKLCRRHSTHWHALKEFDPGTTPFCYVSRCVECTCAATWGVS
jgi:hypothetical protein